MPILDAEDPAPKRQRTFGGIKGGLSGQAKDDDGENAAHVGSGRVKSPWERRNFGRKWKSEKKDGDPSGKEGEGGRYVGGTCIDRLKA